MRLSTEKLQKKIQEKNKKHLAEDSSGVTLDSRRFRSKFAFESRCFLANHDDNAATADALLG